jgi:hypothetical protein
MNDRSKRHQKLLRLNNTEMAILILKYLRFQKESNDYRTLINHGPVLL